jgi:prophage tail gpP-like protein
MSLASAATGLLSGKDSKDPQLTLAVNGKRYGGWTYINVERSLDIFTHSFSLRYTDTWAANSEPWKIRDGDAAQIFFGDELMLTGYVNVAEWQVSAKDWQLTSNGRSKSGDLEDCSAFHVPGRWKNKSPVAIIQDLVKPFGMTVSSTEADALLSGNQIAIIHKKFQRHSKDQLKPLTTFSLEEGETVHDAIERLCKQTVLLAISLPDGNIELIRSDVPRDKVVTLPVGDCISRKVTTNDQDRFSQYDAIGQSRGNVNNAGEAVISPRQQAKDEGVKRFRPLVVIAEHAVSQRDQLTARAVWERNVRAGRSMRYFVTIPGVLAPNGKIWTPGWHCVVKDGPLGVDDTLLLVRANVRADTTELVTELEFTLPEAYSALVYPPRKQLNPKPQVEKPVDICLSQEALDDLIRAKGGTP